MGTSSTGGALPRRVSRVLVVEDDPGDADLIRAFLEPEREIVHVPTLALALEALHGKPFDVALVDAGLPDAKGVEAVETISRVGTCAVMLLTGTDSQALGAAAAQCGALDYLVKGEFTGRQLSRAVACAIQRHESSVQFRALLYQSPDGVLIVDEGGVVRLANRAACTAFGLDESELVGLPMGVPSATSTELVLPFGRQMEIHTSDVRWQGERAWLIHLRDVTQRNQMMLELARANEKLESLVMHDPLTGLLNRRGLEAVLTRTVAASSRTNAPLSVMLVDCDEFKSINDAGGYTGGDTALQLVAEVLRASTRPSQDHVSRIGGDEFMVLLPETTEAEALVVAERIRLGVRDRPLQLTAGTSSSMTVSLGLAIVPHAADLTAVIALTQSSLQRSKREGKDRITIEGAATPTELEALLRQPQALRVMARPIRTAAGGVVGVEVALAGPRGSELEAPERWAAEARRAGVSSQVGVLSLERCLEAAGDALEPLHLQVSVAMLLETPLAELTRLIQQRPPMSVVLQVSTLELVGDPSPLAPVLGALRTAGARIALDDFAFGKNALEAVMVLAPHQVRLSPCLSRDVATEPGVERTLARLMRCLSGLDLEVSAVCGDSPADLAVLSSVGVTLVQPLAFVELDRWERWRPRRCA